MSRKVGPMLRGRGGGWLGWGVDSGVDAGVAVGDCGVATSRFGVA